MPPQLTSSPEIPRLVQRTLPVLLGLALVGIAPACTLIGVEPDEIDLITGETSTDSGASTSASTGTDSAGEEGTDTDTGDGDGDAATGDGDGDPTGTDSDTDPTGADSNSGETDDTDTSTDSATDSNGTEEPGENCGELVGGELADGPNEIELVDESTFEDPCGIGEALAVYTYVPSADGTLTVTSSGFTEAVSLTAYGPECAEEFLLSNTCNADLDVPVVMGETIYLVVQVADVPPVVGNLDLTIN